MAVEPVMSRPLACYDDEWRKVEVGRTCGFSPDPDSRHDKRQAKDKMLLSFPSTKGQEPTGTLTCVGTGANRTWESLWAHGHGLAQTVPGQRQSTFKDDPYLVCPSSPLLEANRRY